MGDDVALAAEVEICHRDRWLYGYGYGGGVGLVHSDAVELDELIENFLRRT